MPAARTIALTTSLVLLAGSVAAYPLSGQSPPDRVLVRTLDEGPEGRLAVDRGASGVWQRLQEVATTASVLYTAGHPDDEESGVLTLLSRGMGVRTGLLTLNRGEGGANAIGPELFDALGLIRTEELRLAGRYYGLDDQYFTTAVDYGYSKTLDEALRSWNREAVLGDMVRVIRLNRPLVVISRWHGSARDGHGHHQASGVLTPEAVAAAADPNRFPEQIRDEGLRPWRVRHVYRGRLLADEAHDAELDPHVVDPWLGESYQDFGSYGLSLQRSQTAGRRRTTRGPTAPARYERVGGALGDTGSTSIFGDLDTSLAGAADLMEETIPPATRAALADAGVAVARALETFDARSPAGIVPDLTYALSAIRRARSGLNGSAPDTEFVLAIKERQLADAIAAAAGVVVSAQATPRGAAAGTPLAVAVPGQDLDVHVDVRATAGGPASAALIRLTVRSRAGWPGGSARDLALPHYGTLALQIPGDATPSRPWFYRPDIRRNQYLVRDSAELHLGEDRPAAEVVATFAVPDGSGASIPIEVVAPVRTLESAAPWGSLSRPLVVAPALSVRASPSVLIEPRTGRATVSVEVTSNATTPLDAEVTLAAPEGLRTDPPQRRMSFTGPDQTATATFDLLVPTGAAAGSTDPLHTRARVVADGVAYAEGYRMIAHRDLRPQRLYEDATVTLYPVRPAVADGLRVGYVMGVGDDVPNAIGQLGATVHLLDADALSGGDLDEYDVIVVGTRAYAVRPDLIASNGRLLDYARAGGNLVVLYQTPEYDPATQAPVPAELPGNAEEVSEEDAPVTILAPEHPLLRTPNPIGPGDFDGWIEQRGSKFFTTWDAAYTPLIETHDTGQPPQRGVWLSAPVGDGHFTYVALALQRQLPYGVAGAYRILANLLSLGR